MIETQHIPFEASVFKQYSKHLHDYLHQCYFTPLSYKDQIPSKEQAKIVASIRMKIKQFNLIIRLTDKGNNFYIASAIEFEKKVQKFFSDTHAFVELSANPFNEILIKVTQVLNRLRQTKFIFQWQYDKMMPDKKTCELAHLYFNPKTHKV